MKKQNQLSFVSNRQAALKLKIVMVGDQSVGKSSIILKYAKNDFDNANNPTIGIDFTSKNLIINQQSIRLQLWDTAGQERFRSLIPSYLKDCNLAIIVYDLTNSNGLDNIQKWIEFVRQARGSQSHICIVGNKIDLTQQIKQDIRQRAKRRASELDFPYFQVSALSGLNIQKMFQQFVKKSIKIMSESKIVENKSQSINQNDQIKKSDNPVVLNSKPISISSGKRGLCC